MHDWSGSRVRADAETVPCRYCHAIAGKQCITEFGTALEAFPAHTMRVSDSRKTADHPYAEEPA